ncbi:MAG: prolyl aminopeptidase-like protein [uncultured bacterium]|nr:MAG: prolyl aminopeptidase-like protein [uncultured bacterium]OGT09483.1 MAG: hypothetical protein A2V89_01555 [Gammaproteobacteria bacterium RBG_16_37_9]HBC72064.1 hypothetical protein [Coxiellaceae bacterium]HBS52046.1 hypothetical protein [Coxiellaceae bacterium]HBY56052.1 hypothetical protein [Coxiellaceae bacterium]
MLKQIKRTTIIVLSIIILSIIPFRASAEDYITVYPLEKTLPVVVRGKGLPMLVVGPATLFLNGYLPKSFYDHFKVYFVDIFTKTSSPDSLDIKKITLDDFVDSIESIRSQLKLDKVVLFGHSANGVLALLYSNKFHDHVLCNILVGTSPFRGVARETISKTFFEANASPARKELYYKDQRQLKEFPSTFVNQYNAKRALNFFNPVDKKRLNIWEGINLDEELINRYFSLIDGFNIRQYTDILKVPIFLGLGLHDYNCPFDLWTSESKEVLKNPLIKCYIFNESAHFPMIEEEAGFVGQLLLFLREYRIVDAEGAELES